MSAPPKKMGMSLYADLLGEKKSEGGATISGAPVTYDSKKNEADGEGQKKKDASLQFQPIRRPQAQPKISRPKQGVSSSSAHKFSSSTASASTSTGLGAATSTPDRAAASSTISDTPTARPSAQRSKLEDWVDEDDEAAYTYQENRARAKKNQRKKTKNKHETRIWDWDDIYDPTLPNNYADYKGSEEQYREIRDWKARLYYQQLKEANKSRKESQDQSAGTSASKMFAPPPNLNFAPPSFDDSAPRSQVEDNGDDYYPPSLPKHSENSDNSYQARPTAAPTSSTIPPEEEDPYLRRMRMSGQAPTPPQNNVPPPPPPPAQQSIPPVASAQPLGDDSKATADIENKRAEALAKIAAFKAKLAAQGKVPSATASPTPPVAATQTAPPAAAPLTVNAASQPPPPPPVEEPEQPGVVASKGAVRYNLPPPPPEVDNLADLDPSLSPSQAAAADQPDAPRSKAPGQKGFAERLLKKYGWEKGKGLGAEGNEGIATAVVAKAEKRKKLPDQEGGGWAAPKNMGKLVGGKRRKLAEGEKAEAEGEGADGAGELSEVVKLEGMCKGMDLDSEIQDNGLYDEIGKEMETQYGSVERLMIWRREQGGDDDVFVKFTSQLSALRCVQAMSGVEFAGNEVKARFWDKEKFEAGDYA
ncbi:hypothetical protein KC340_g10952 [Hortaea werneckii]|nr:hypothetical protein KC342_g1241 [Hortaea werneckii]KAI7106734.1 hypothetical protein KC339_g2887 [Hortaea werneckii]KAI7210438.1 hypothetical protein KC365_g15307 [Hortaea werneckii]KAI7308693.1 hypothetical protein KC340_g10952 [Hortaea werneckii]KAI7407593.1 hypothetical protein KC328_g424 [Hortaea werneckii]